MTIIYRILSFFINIVSLMLAISLIGSSRVIFSSPQTMLSGFLMLAVILYSWFSARFKREVLQRQQIVNMQLRDWVRVNGIVTLIFSIISVISIVPLLFNPTPFMEALRQFEIVISEKKAVLLFSLMLLYAVFLLIHTLWTFALIKKNIRFFQLAEREE